MNSQRRQGHGLPAMVLGHLITEANLAVLEREQPAIGQRDPVDIPAQVAEPLFAPLQGRFAVDDPRLVHTDSGMASSGRSRRTRVQEETSEELGERPDRHRVGLAGRPPLGPISGDPAGWHQAMDVRLGDQRPGPGVQDAQAPDQPPTSCGSAASVMSAGAAARRRCRTGPSGGSGPAPAALGAG